MKKNGTIIKKIEGLFNSTGIFEQLKIKSILIEGELPVLFTGVENDTTYLFSHKKVNGELLTWVGVEIDRTTLKRLFNKELTVRQAYTDNKYPKYVFELHEDGVSGVVKNHSEVPGNILPPTWCYLNTENVVALREVCS